MGAGRGRTKNKHRKLKTIEKKQQSAQHKNCRINKADTTAECMDFVTGTRPKLVIQIAYHDVRS